MKNIDVIRQMTAKELARYICNHSQCDTCNFRYLDNCNEKFQQWLEQESEE